MKPEIINVKDMDEKLKPVYHAYLRLQMYLYGNPNLPQQAIDDLEIIINAVGNSIVGSYKIHPN